MADILHKPLVDLDDVGLENDQALKTATAKTHIIDRDADLPLFEFLDHTKKIGWIAQDLLLANFDAISAAEADWRKEL